MTHENMGLQGRLSDFTLEEILQLIALQQKTGLLRVDASYPMALYFEQGMLVSFRDRRATGSDPLETFLKGYGFFPNASWEHVDFVQRNSELDLSEILVNEGLVTTEELAVIQLEAAQEYLYHGMRLRDGHYNFSTGRAALEGLKGRVRMKVDGLLMESVRRIDEMPELEKRFYDGLVKVRRTAEEVDLAHQSAGVRRVLAVLDEESTVSHLVAHARMSEFDTLTTLEALRQQGTVTLHAPPKQQKQAAEREALEREQESEGISVTQMGIAVLCLVVTFLVVFLQPMRLYADRNTIGTQRAQQLWFDRDRDHLAATLDVYRRAHGRYPSELTELREQSYVSQGFLARVESRLEYVPTGRPHGYRLEPRSVEDAPLAR